VPPSGNPAAAAEELPQRQPGRIRGNIAGVHYWASGWRSLAHLVLDVLLFSPYVVALTLMTVGALATPVLLAGVPVYLLGRLLVRVAARLECGRLRSLLGVKVPGPALSEDAPGDPARPLWWRRTFLDAVAWRAALHLFVVCTAGLVGGTTALTFAGIGLAAVLAPIAGVRSPGGQLALPLGILEPFHAPAVVLVAAGLIVLALTPLLARALTVSEVATGRRLLGPPRSVREALLERRVETLTSARGKAVDSADSERRRIERDLHDGPQQRLVALAMQLGMARRALDREGADAARPLLEAASGMATAAISDMRHVVRGIHPPVLTDRGLDAAFSALAASSPVPVDVEVHFTLLERPSATVEAIAYFCVSEALTNTAKHAGATRASVQAWRRSQAPARTGRQDDEGVDVLHVRVADDGHGGASAGTGTLATGGSGLRGLADRVASVDGVLTVDSPLGGPTTLDFALPWAGVRR